jgi:UDP-N-acetylglucosamine 2-epimerase (non-hydrolysing)
LRPRFAIIFGTRPEIVKLGPLIRCAAAARANFFLIHSGQHYSPDMDSIFMRDLALPKPLHRLDGRTRNGRHGEHVGRLMTQIETILINERPTHVVVQGDTNTVLAASLAAAKLPDIRIAHVEAGLRSFDRRMPEETNRILTDHMSQLLFAPTQEAAALLRAEGIPQARIRVTGNTVVDAVRLNRTLARSGASFAVRRLRSSSPYGLVTLHRQENVDSRSTLAGILAGLGRATKELGSPLLFPAHPRTLDRIKKFRLKLPRGLNVMPPVGYLDFLHLEEGARLILTDSGGVQEEACILRVPCVTLRTSTERPETIAAGGNLLAGCDPGAIHRASKKILARGRDWRNPFGDGHASDRILKALEQDASRQGRVAA